MPRKTQGCGKVYKQPELTADQSRNVASENLPDNEVDASLENCENDKEDNEGSPRV